MNERPVIAGDVQAWAAQFGAALEAGDSAAALALFADTCFWRDLVAFGWTIATHEGPDAIRALLQARLAATAPRALVAHAPAGATEGFIAFETALGPAQGYVRTAGGRAVTLMTMLDGLNGHPEASGTRRPLGTGRADGLSWQEGRAADHAAWGTTRQPYVLVVGGGQGGLGLAARLKLLGVPALVVDSHPRIGDQWRSRYRSLTLHDPVWYDHMPCLPFPASWPVYTPKDKMADWLEHYADILELDVWTGTRFEGAERSGDIWQARVRRDGKLHELRPSHIVMAVGNAGFPKLPVFEGMDRFRGDQRHSSAHPGGAGFAGRKVVVVGANNSAHDICADLVEHGADVTMVQRSPTLVVKQSTFVDQMLKPLWSEEAVAAGMTTERADLMAASGPIRLIDGAGKAAYKAIGAMDADLYGPLANAGFALHFGVDDAGLHPMYLRKASGYYIDVGACQMIIDGRIKLRSPVGVERIVEDGLVLTDGSHLAADAIVYATGFGAMEEWVGQLLGPDVAARLGRCWGYGAGYDGDPGPWEGELRNMWKPTAVDGLWFHGGNLQQSRFYSKILALQLKARLEGLPVAVFAS